MNYRKIFFRLGFLIILLSVSLLFKTTVLAAYTHTCNCVGGPTTGMDGCSTCSNYCMENGNKAVDSCVAAASGSIIDKDKETSPASPRELPNPLGKGVTVELMIARIINFVLSLVGSISLLMFIYGGLTWMTSAGSQEKVKKGREIIVWAIIGLAVVFFSYLLVRFVISGLTG